MGWWTAFDRDEVAADFDRIATCGFDSVRIFLTWEDFQPTPSRVDSAMLDRLVSALDEAHSAGLSIMPTLFTGHMRANRSGGRVEIRSSNLLLNMPQIMDEPVDF